MVIILDELQAATDKLFAHFKETDVDSVELAEDYYWWISKEQIYNPNTEPTEFTIGQLSDDWNELRKMLDGKSDPLGYHLVWLSAILRAIGEKIVS